MYNDLEELARESVKNQPEEKFKLSIFYITHYINKIFNKWMDQDSPFQHYGLRHK